MYGLPILSKDREVHVTGLLVFEALDHVVEVRPEGQDVAVHDAKENAVKNPRKLLDEIKQHIEQCPLGYYPSFDVPGTMTVCTARGTTPEDIVRWLEELKRLANSV